MPPPDSFRASITVATSSTPLATVIAALTRYVALTSRLVRSTEPGSMALAGGGADGLGVGAGRDEGLGAAGAADGASVRVGTGAGVALGAGEQPAAAPASRLADSRATTRDRRRPAFNRRADGVLPDFERDDHFDLAHRRCWAPAGRRGRRMMLPRASRATGPHGPGVGSPRCRPSRRSMPSSRTSAPSFRRLRLLTDDVDREAYRLDETAYLDAGLPGAVALPADDGRGRRARAARRASIGSRSCRAAPAPGCPAARPRSRAR